MNAIGPLTRSDRVATLEEAKAQFQRSWDAWKAWAKLGETEWLRSPSTSVQLLRRCGLLRILGLAAP